MGAGRKTQTINVDSSLSVSEHGYITFRNLHKNDLGGTIFGCTHTTLPECLSKQLFGLPSSHFSYVRNIVPGLPIFLFNYSDRKLHGVYEAASQGQMNIDAYAWTDGGAERTAFPAQAHIRIREQCKPLTEKEYKKVIEDNYYTPQHFWFELDHLQTRCLMALFKPLLPTIAPVVHPHSQANPVPALPAPKWKKKDAQGTSSENKNKSAILSSDDRNSGNSFPNKTLPIATEEIDIKEPMPNLEDLFQDQLLNGMSSNFGTNFDDVTENFDEPVDVEDYNNILLKLSELSTNCKFLPFSKVFGESTSSDIPKDSSDHRKQLDHSYTSTMNKENLSADNLYNEKFKTNDQLLDFYSNKEHQVEANCYDGNANRDSGKMLNESLDLVNQEKDSTSTDVSQGTSKLLEDIRELKERTANLEKQQVESDAEIQHLRNLHRNSGRIIQLLCARLGDLETKIGTSSLLDNHLDTFVDQYLASEDLIYLIGGYSGSAWLSAFDSFSPTLDILTPLKSMSCVRSYASAVELNGVIYALGGGDGSSWYDTVERYDQRHNEWTSCPNMIHKKGSLAGATLNGKIYAIGGGDGYESFSDVEMFDPALGRWMSWHPMFHKRFAPAAAELNGAVYAVGGYDGQNYSKSAERLDPREVSWARMPDMKISRGCHSMAVLNDKLFVMGGYDGEELVPSVEVYDPRANAWMDGIAMNSCRGYAASALLGGSLFIIGGIENGEKILDTIECYKEGDGWSVSRLKAVGKRCFFSAIVL